jgi:hypothetical protein
MPPDSSSTTLSLLFAKARASEMPAGPPPMMARSGVNTVPAGSERASIRAVKDGYPLQKQASVTFRLEKGLVLIVSKIKASSARDFGCWPGARSDVGE